MKLMRPAALTALVVCAVAATTSAAPPHGGSARARCPRQALAAPTAVEDVVRAARRLLPRVYHLTNQQGPVKLTRKNTEILEVVSLNPSQPRLVGAARLRRLARSRCGRVADASWALGVYFTELTVADNLSFAFLTRTSRGWRIWR